MRVLHVCKYYPPFSGGMETFVGDLLPELKTHGVECCALAHAHDRASITGGALDAYGVEVTRVPTWGRLLYAPVSPRFPLWMEEAIRRTRPDIIHFHMPNTSALWALMSRAAAQIPWVVHWHSDVVASTFDKRLAIAYPIYRPFEQALLSRSRAIIATSPPYLKASRALQPWQAKCRVIPLGLAPKRRLVVGEECRIWAERQWSGVKFKILCIGRLTYYKGHQTLLHAMAKVENAKLILIGEGEHRGELDRLVDALGLREKVALIGHRTDEEKQALLDNCDVFCLPSIERTEAFGVVLLEAMCAGKPAIAGDVPGSGMGWVVNDGSTGLLVPPGDANALCAALFRLQSDPGLRNAIGKAAKQRFEREFQMSRVANDIIGVYRAVVENATGR